MNRSNKYLSLIAIFSTAISIDLFLNLFMLSILPYNMVFKPYNK